MDSTRAVMGLVVVGLEDIEKVFGIAGDVAGPVAKAAVGVHGLDPLR